MEQWAGEMKEGKKSYIKKKNKNKVGQAARERVDRVS